ncbi:hypothetical protein P7K49_023003 [Saguinus oedipus]|uniref:Uncharacterized protein n=1 Tax=Saguinus oedipus TaxID=9490 RepID=A0ABQ9UMP6_SAGOE|nr:hypothetical protein P7K49_023003 [Saguinus oedipus]
MPQINPVLLAGTLNITADQEKALGLAIIVFVYSQPIYQDVPFEGNFLETKMWNQDKLEKEGEWKGPFYFILGTDPQFGLMKAWSTGDCDNGGDEWGQEIRLTEQAVQAVNKLNPKPKFFVLCGDLIHAMPGKDTAQQADISKWRVPLSLREKRDLRPLQKTQ